MTTRFVQHRSFDAPLSPVMEILHGFAQAQTRMTEREVHHGDERPEGSGWVRIEIDPSGYSTWERSRYVRAAR